MGTIQRDRSMLATTEPSSINPWWAAIAVPVIMFLGAVLKTWSEMWQGRDNSQAKWRQEIIEWNGRQETRIIALEGSVKTEQDLRHQIKGELFKEQMAHELLKAEHTRTVKDCEQHQHDLEALKIEHAKLQAEHDRLCNLRCGKLVDDKAAAADDNGATK